MWIQMLNNKFARAWKNEILKKPQQLKSLFFKSTKAFDTIENFIKYRNIGILLYFI